MNKWTFRWPHWVPWRRWVMMRYAVREHRRLHDDKGTNFIMRGEWYWRSSRKMGRMMRRVNDQRSLLLGQGTTLHIPRFERLTSDQIIEDSAEN